MGGVIEPRRDQGQVFIFVCNIHMAMIVTVLLILLLSFFLQCHICILSEIINNPMACKMEREKIRTTYQLLLALLVGLIVLHYDC